MEDGKMWVRVDTSGRGHFKPSFEELAYMTWGIALCEAKKYPKSEHKGAMMVVDFLRRVAMMIMRENGNMKAYAESEEIPERFVRTLHREWDETRRSLLLPDKRVQLLDTRGYNNSDD